VRAALNQKGLGSLSHNWAPRLSAARPAKRRRIEQREGSPHRLCREGCHMENAAYLRARAERCLRLASLLSDPDAAQALVAKAAELHGHALELEQRTLFQKS
jgi:hypothetical protein